MNKIRDNQDLEAIIDLLIERAKHTANSHEKRMWFRRINMLKEMSEVEITNKLNK